MQTQQTVSVEEQDFLDNPFDTCAPLFDPPTGYRYLKIGEVIELGDRMWPKGANIAPHSDSPLASISIGEIVDGTELIVYIRPV